MPFKKETVRHEIDIPVAYDADLYKKVLKERKDPETNKPFRNITQVCFSLRKIANANPSRIAQLDKIVREHKKVIVFYNFIYELDILKAYAEEARFTHAEWNGGMHEKIPTTSSWLYFVQYTAGAEGWNCIETNTIVFYSQNYSYKIMAQAAGRIDRLNTTFKDLYYYYFRSKAPIDRAIHKALLNKENFNESLFLKA
jgi:superfamily II DNA or RNA helicase